MKKSKVNGKDFLIVVLTLVATALIIHDNGGFHSWVSDKLEIKEGQCYLSKDYEFFQVESVYSTLKEVYFKPMEVKNRDFYTFWLEPKTMGSGRFRFFETVQNGYTLIPCDHNDLN